CWLYRGALNQDGYCRVRHYGRSTMGHRVIWEEFHGEIPASLTLDHICRNRACVNPWHTDPVPQQVNARRVPAKTHCPAGHEYTPSNTYRSTKGSAYCRQCHLTRCAERRRRRPTNGS